MLTISLFSYWANILDVMEMGAELTETVQRLAFLERIFGADVSFELTLPLAQKSAILTSDPDGIGPAMKCSSLRFSSVVPEFLFRNLYLASVHNVSSVHVY